METFATAVRVALGAIFTNKLRSFLTMLGIIIGVGSVILLTSIGNGLQVYITQQFQSFGATNIYVFPGDSFSSGGGVDFAGQQSALLANKLTLKEVKSIQKLRDYVVAVAPEFTTTSLVSFGKNSKRVMIYGTNSSYADITVTKASKGRFFTNQEEAANERVAVLGSEIAKTLFGEADPIGKRIQVGSLSFQVVGVAEPRGGGGFIGATLDTIVYAPITTVMRMSNGTSVTQLTIQTVSREKMPEAVAAVKKELLKKFEKEDFSVVDQSQVLSTVNSILGVLTVGLGGIAAISLVVGGIGILNIMLVSVIERTREIGLRKALGATPNVILIQFLIEASTLSVLGGAIGTALAYLITLGINVFMPAVVTLPAVIMAFGVSGAIGIIFGVIPARRASMLSPIEALRYE